jgi:hypothetical protein
MTSSTSFKQGSLSEPLGALNRESPAVAPSTLDLGLAALLEGKTLVREASESLVAASSLGGPFPPVLSQEPSAAAAQLVPKRSAFEVLAEEGLWQKLRTLCERRLLAAREPPDIEAQLWWIKAQLALREVPISVLTAPLDTLSREILRTSPDEISETLPKIKAHLAVTLQEVITRFEKESSLVEGEKELLSTFKKRVRQLRGTQAEEGVPPVIERGVVREELPNDSALESRRPRLSVRRLRKRRRIQRLWYLASIIIGASAGLTGLALGGVFDQPSPRLIRVPLVVSPEKASLRLPLLAPQKGSSLDEILYRLDGRSEKGAPGEYAALKNIATSSRKSGTDEKQKASSSKELINVQGPLESELPNLSNVPLRASNASEKSTYRSPFDRATVLEDSALTAKGLDSIEEFSPSRRYVIVTAQATVTSRPTFSSSAVFLLSKGDMIDVEGRIGQWLRIRSRKGARGFVLLADARPSV